MGAFASKVAADKVGTDRSAPGAVDTQAWAGEFAVTQAQIDAAIAAVGSNKADVEMYLKGSHASTDGDITQQAS